MPKAENKNPNKKLNQFLEEIDAVSKRYQYAIRPALDFNTNGITPKLTVVEVIPPKVAEVASPKEEKKGVKKVA